MRSVEVVITCALLSLCATPVCADGGRAGLEFIGEDIVPSGFLFQGTEVGGLSGIDYDPSSASYVAISDDRVSPRFYDLKIDLSDGRLDAGDVTFVAATGILDLDGEPFEPLTADPEGIRLQAFPGLIYWSSEGDATQGILPFVRIATRAGQPVAEFELPEKYKPTADSGIRNNLAFESLTFGHGSRTLLTATENALIQDGPRATPGTGSPSRVLVLNKLDGKTEREYVYATDPVAAPPVPADAFSTNGLVELLTLERDMLIAVERSFSVGVGNTIKLFLASTRGATDVRALQSIEGRRIRPMNKQLLLDLGTLGIPLDNVEGITFGPKLDGAPTLILVSDNNFNAVDQFTQFLAFRLRKHGRD